MREVSVRELRNHTASVVARVEAGEALALTVNGRPVADLVPHGSRRHSISMAELAELFDHQASLASTTAEARDLSDLTTDDLVEEVEAGYRRARES